MGLKVQTNERFSIYESVLLLEAYLNAAQERVSLNSAVKPLSLVLRQMAVNQGIQIDDAFRSEKGLNYQIRCMEAAYTAKKTSCTPSRLFIETVALYKSNRTKYDALLVEAKSFAFKENEEVMKEKNILVDGGIETSILDVIARHFPNGFQPDSIIDRKKLFRLYEEETEKGIPDGFDIKALINNCGITVGKKVYVLSKEAKNEICSKINSLFATGNNVLFYNLLLKLPIFEECHIYEVSTLKEVVRMLLPNAAYEKHYMCSHYGLSVLQEIVDAYGRDIKLTYSQIQKRKPYMDLDTIKWELSYSDKFVWDESETYAQAHLIKLADTDILKIQSEFLPEVESRGFATMLHLPLADSCALNPSVSYYAVREVMYLRHMSGKYSKNGLIVTRIGETKTSYEVLCEYCRSLEKATLEEINHYGQALLGNQPTTIVSAAIYNMVRVDRAIFVNDAAIEFDVDAIDRAIEQFVGDKIIPLKNITSFTAFPEVEGYSWNLYILDCFLRRFSKKFSMNGSPAQTNIVGAVCPKEIRFDSYADAMAYAVVQDGVEISENTISDYLSKNQFILRRGLIVRRVFESAMKISEQRSAGNV